MSQVVPASSNSAAFLLPRSDSSPQPVTYAAFQGFLNKYISTIDLDQHHFSSHSFRRGGATWAFYSNVPRELIKVHGDWASDSYLKYLDFSLDQRLKFATFMSLTLPEDLEYVVCWQELLHC